MKTKIIKYNLFVVTLCIVWACQSTYPLYQKQFNSLEERITQSPVFSKGFTGFMLFDPNTQQSLFEQNAAKYFTPASNTKIFTLYTALQILGDELAICNYDIHGDSLIFWGTGNPLLLHPEHDHSDTLIHFLKQHRDKKLFLSNHNFQDDRFGSGWMWDDYTGGFQAEKAAMPIYGNLAWIKTDSNRTISIEPPYFEDHFRFSDLLTSKYARTSRLERSNDFIYNQKAHQEIGYSRVIPFIHSPEIVVQCLRPLVGQEIHLLEKEIPLEKKVFQQSMPDSVYRQLMLPSDNFIAEQLLLLCSDRLFDTISTTKIIAYAKDSLLADAPDQLRWYDGSGISRYNLFTPRTIVYVLQKMYQQYPEERLFSLFAQGGVSGTIRKWYAAEQPYIFAKTGTLRNQHCLSGYIKTDNGRTLIFSFMHNNFNSSSRPLKGEMQKILEYIKTNF